MYKEAVISVITIIIILILNFVTENYTKSSVLELTNQLTELRIEIKQTDVENDKISKRIENIWGIWNNRYNLLAYYLEHDELEKIATNLNSLNGELETKEYHEAVSEIDKTIFILNHIEEKNKFDLKNIF